MPEKRKIRKVKRNKKETDYDEKLNTAFHKASAPLFLYDCLRFGKYKGKTIKFIISTDPTYIKWMLDKKIIKLDTEAFSEFVASLQKKQQQQQQQQQQQRQKDSSHYFRWENFSRNGAHSEHSWHNNAYNHRDNTYTRQESTGARTRSTTGNSVDLSRLLPAFRYDHLPTRTKNGRLLRLSGKVTRETIKTNYRKLAIIFHPDKCVQLDEVFQEVAGTMFKEIQNAYEYFKAEYSL